MERNIEFKRELYKQFVDFRQALDIILRKGLWHILKHYGVPDEIVKIVEDMYKKFMPNSDKRWPVINSQQLLKSSRDA